MMTLIFSLFCAFAEPSQTVSQLGPVEVGKDFPIFGGYTSNNDYVSFKNSLGKSDLTVVSYFATWCAPCKKNLPTLEAFIQKNSNVQGFYIALEKESSKVNTFAKELNLNTPIVMDKFESFAKKHGIILEDGTASLPKTFVIDKAGKVLDIFVLEGDDFHELLSKRLK